MIMIVMIIIKMYQLEWYYCKNVVEAVTSINAIQSHDIKQQNRMQTLKPCSIRRLKILQQKIYQQCMQTTVCASSYIHMLHELIAKTKQVAQLSQRCHAAGCVSFWPKYKLKMILCTKHCRQQKSKSSDLFTWYPNTGSLLTQTVSAKKGAGTVSFAHCAINCYGSTFHVTHVQECDFYLP